jgi:hypothetical protein
LKRKKLSVMFLCSNLDLEIHIRFSASMYIRRGCCMYTVLQQPKRNKN